MTDQDQVFCQCCGQKCQPEAYQRPAEDYDEGTGGMGMVNDWRSPCCDNGLSVAPVTDQCNQCGEVAARGAEFPQVDGEMLCPRCLGESRMAGQRFQDLSEDD